MQTVFLVAFIAGLVLNVYFMIRGAERWRASDVAARLDAFGRELGFGRISLGTPVIAALASAFGLAGYLLMRYASLGTWLTVVLASVAAGAAVFSAIWLVKRWALPAAERDVPDERFVLQGQLARVSVAIPFGGSGEITYLIDDRTFVTRAQSLDGTAVAAGTDVVIERVEGDIVYVEDWSRVEQRL
jgi:membrane protein implicated in regulation of membrane protease activity